MTNAGLGQISNVRLGDTTESIPGVVCQSESSIRSIHAAASAAARSATPRGFNTIPADCAYVRARWTPQNSIARLGDVNAWATTLDDSGSNQCEFADSNGVSRSVRCRHSRTPLRFFSGRFEMNGQSYQGYFYLGPPSVEDQYAARQQRRPDSVAGVGRPAASPVSFGADEESRPQRRPNSDGDIQEEQEVLIGI